MKLDFREAPPVKVTDFSHKKKYEARLLPATATTVLPRTASETLASWAVSLEERQRRAGGGSDVKNRSI